jgi:hypothetical protein
VKIEAKSVVLLGLQKTIRWRFSRIHPQLSAETQFLPRKCSAVKKGFEKGPFMNRPLRQKIYVHHIFISSTRVIAMVIAINLIIVANHH